jgi:hypothetical protein
VGERWGLPIRPIGAGVVAVAFIAGVVAVTGGGGGGDDDETVTDGDGLVDLEVGEADEIAVGAGGV